MSWAHVLWKTGTISKRENFLWNGKILCEEASKNLLKPYLSFGGDLEGCIEKRWRGNRKRGSVVKFREMLSEGEGGRGAGGLRKSCGILRGWLAELLELSVLVYDVCLEKNSVNVCGLWSRRLFLAVPVWKSVRDGLTVEAELGVWVARKGTRKPRSSNGSRMNFSHNNSQNI